MTTCIMFTRWLSVLPCRFFASKLYISNFDLCPFSAPCTHSGPGVQVRGLRQIVSNAHLAREGCRKSYMKASLGGCKHREHGRGHSHICTVPLVSQFSISSSPAPPTPWSPNTFSEMASVCIIPCYSNLCELQCNFWRPVCGQNSVSLQKLRSGGLTYVQLFTRLPGPPG